jgi:hypothetical protein
MSMRPESRRLRTRLTIEKTATTATLPIAVMAQAPHER